MAETGSTLLDNNDDEDDDDDSTLHLGTHFVGSPILDPPSGARRLKERVDGTLNLTAYQMGTEAEKGCS